jgi:hypothetical protein
MAVFADGEQSFSRLWRDIFGTRMGKWRLKNAGECCPQAANCNCQVEIDIGTPSGQGQLMERHPAILFGFMCDNVMGGSSCDNYQFAFKTHNAVESLQSLGALLAL